jgi:hypothetical protein
MTTVILGVLSGIFLILISAIAAYLLWSGHLQSLYPEPSN